MSHRLAKAKPVRYRSRSTYFPWILLQIWRWLALVQPYGSFLTAQWARPRHTHRWCVACQRARVTIDAKIIIFLLITPNAKINDNIDTRRKISLLSLLLPGALLCWMLSIRRTLFQFDTFLDISRTIYVLIHGLRLPICWTLFQLDVVFSFLNISRTLL